MSVRFVKPIEPCKRCGGRLSELSNALFGVPSCHYCGSTTRIPFGHRIDAWTSSLRETFARNTRFKRTPIEEPAPKTLADQLRAAMSDISLLYVQGARDALQTVTSEVAGDESEFVDACALLGRSLLLKLVAGTLPTADCPPPLAALVMQHLCSKPWSQTGENRELSRLLAFAPDLDWRMVLRPFQRLPSFRRRTAEFVTHSSRVVNLVIKFDGVVTEEELERQRALLGELRDHIAGFPRLPPPTHQPRPDPLVFDQLREDAAWLRGQMGSLAPESTLQPGANPLQAALRDLDALVGIDLVKQDMRGLVDVLELKAERRRVGQPDADLRFHVAFIGNEGTGQGTVAGILGRISAALGALERGHLVETSGEALAEGEAEVDERFGAARDGVLLVHHASRLQRVAERSAKASSTWKHLCKRAEQDRERLVLVLSDQEQPIERLLESEPALSVRIRRLRFDDYSVVELGRVLERMVRENRYRLSRQARLEVLNGLDYWVTQTGALPGNARALRALFESAVERQAQRMARASNVNSTTLTLMDAEDFLLNGVPVAVRERVPASIRTECPRCGRSGRFPAALLGERIQCRACQHEMFADWGVPSHA